jgi:hypothetical protein
MNIKASGRSALIIATGLLVCLWGPLQITETAAATSSEVSRASAAQEGRAAANAALKKVARHRARHLHHARRHAHKSVALNDKATTETKVAAIDVADSGDDGLPPAVANANAQLSAADSAAGDAPPAKSDRVGKAATNAQNSPPSPADAAIVASDELNDIDLAVTETSPRPAPAKVAGASVAPADDDTWSKTSIIGKLFIAFGGLLTLASAARMFMA